MNVVAIQTHTSVMCSNILTIGISYPTCGCDCTDNSFAAYFMCMCGCQSISLRSDRATFSVIYFCIRICTCSESIGDGHVLKGPRCEQCF